MKLINKDKFVNGVKEVVNGVNIEETGNEEKVKYAVKMVVDEAKDKDGVLGVILTIKKVGKTNKEYKVPIYVIESYHKVETLIINNRTCKVLFENSTINSSEIALSYLKGILLNEIGFIRKVEATVASKTKRNFKSRNTNRPDGNRPDNKKGGYNKGYNKSKPGYNKSYGNNNSKPRTYSGQGKPDSRNMLKKADGTTYNNGGYKGDKKYPYQVKTSNKPYYNNNRKRDEQDGE